MNASVNSNRRPRAWPRATLAIVLVPLLAGCGLGETLQITRQGENTFTVEQSRDGMSRGSSPVATLNDDGLLVMQRHGSIVPLVVDEVSGMHTFDRYEKSKRRVVSRCNKVEDKDHDAYRNFKIKTDEH